MSSPISANKAELLAIADSVAREKLIDKAIVLEAMEDAIQRAARARYGAENDIRAKIDPASGDMRLWRVVEVVEQVDDYFKQVNLKDAEKLQPGSAVGDFIVDPLPPIEFGRIAAQAAKQVIFQKVRDAESEGIARRCRRRGPPAGGHGAADVRPGWVRSWQVRRWQVGGQCTPPSVLAEGCRPVGTGAIRRKSCQFVDTATRWLTVDSYPVRNLPVPPKATPVRAAAASHGGRHCRLIGSHRS